MPKSSKGPPGPPPLQVFRHPNIPSIPGRLDFVRGINASIATHSSYQDESMVPIRLALQKCETDLSTMHLAVQGGNRTFVPQREAATAKLDEVLYDFVHMAERKGRTDPNAIRNIGLDSLLITPTKKSVVLPPSSAPSNFEVVNAPHLNQMLASVGTMPGVRSWELWISENPNDESSWYFYQTFFKSSNMLISGRESGKIYYFRIRGVNSGGVSPWSIVVSLRAL